MVTDPRKMTLLKKMCSSSSGCDVYRPTYLRVTSIIISRSFSVEPKICDEQQVEGITCIISIIL